MVELLPHHHKVKGSNQVTAVGTGRGKMVSKCCYFATNYSPLTPRINNLNAKFKNECENLRQP